MMMHELVKGYNKKGGKHRIVVKVDLIKAFDMVHRDFVSATMYKMGFPPKFMR